MVGDPAKSEAGTSLSDNFLLVLTFFKLRDEHRSAIQNHSH